MWKIWLIENHGWMKTIHPTLDDKKKKKKNRRMKTLHLNETEK